MMPYAFQVETKIKKLFSIQPQSERRDGLQTERELRIAKAFII